MAEKLFDKCPKCSSTITNEVECETCGIVFQKYLQAEERKRAEADRVKIKVEATGSRNRRLVVLVGLFLILTFAAGIYLGGRSRISIDPPEGTTPEHVTGDPVARKKSFRQATVMPTETAGEMLSEEEIIQRALNATVSVRTPWGSIGSGFFIEEHAVITNKHVVMFDDAHYEEFKNRVERNRKIIDLEIEKIDEWKRKVSQMPPGPNRSQLEIVIQGKEAEARKALSKQRDDEEKLATLTNQKYSQDVRIITADNKEYPIDSIIASPANDLALLRVYAVSGQTLTRNASGQRLEQGQGVYAIGSPMGLSNTVTSGIFSAYRKDTKTEQVYLQFDAAINPGNSGGPLIDKQGNILGVNTMIIAQAEGIGFAIPIEVVFEDFSGSL